MNRRGVGVTTVPDTTSPARKRFDAIALSATGVAADVRASVLAQRPDWTVHVTCDPYIDHPEELCVRAHLTASGVTVTSRRSLPENASIVPIVDAIVRDGDAQPLVAQ